MPKPFRRHHITGQCNKSRGLFIAFASSVAAGTEKLLRYCREEGEIYDDDGYDRYCCCCMDRLGIESHHYFMISCGNAEGAEHIVDAAEFGRLTVDCSLPAPWEIYFGEHYYSVVGRRSFVGQTVGSIGSFFDKAFERRGSFAENIFELLVGNGEN